MPEGPECTRTARQLHRAVFGKQLTNINIISGRYTKTEPSGFSRFISLLDSSPLTVNKVDNKGKFIYWDLGDIFIFTTLGMTGNFKLQPSSHSRVSFYFTDDSSVYYNDQRNFGTIKVVFSKQELETKLNSIGPDMLNNPPTIDTFIDIARKKPKWTLVKWLMDQSQISGVGNIYKSESLFLAKLRPDRLLSSCTDNQLTDLYHAICYVLSTSYESGGSTIRSYSDLFNNEGKYARFASNPQEMVEARKNKVMVYNQKMDIYGNTIQKIKLNDGRTTFWSPEVQK
jgi:formamidopyrimidine-DNA glycosylase